jgi:putative DNA primase/helicase
LDWQANGLVRPASVTEQTEQYFEDQDLLGQFIADRCELDRDYFDLTGRLFDAFEKYARAAGERAGSKKAFGSALKQRGFKADRQAGGERSRGFRGVRLTSADELPIRDESRKGQHGEDYDNAPPG